MSRKAKNEKTGQTERRALEWMILLAPFLMGLFFDWTCAVMSICLAVLLLYMLRRGILRGTGSPAFLAAVTTVCFLALGTLWGTDRGMALAGAVHFLPLPLFVLALEQFPPEERTGFLRKIPCAACVMVILSLLLSKVFRLEGWFLVAGRQAGFFQYPNTYALYLLAALILVLFGERPRFGPIPWLLVLMLGIALSGSRTVFVLLFAVLVFFLFWTRDRKLRMQVLALGGILVLASLGYVIATGNRGSIGRFLTISLSSSEFLGRLLYARDAIPVILKRPLGLGYLGYYWLQGSFQTGVYTVQHVHNEFLQLLLDVGWIPAGLLVWALLRAFRSRSSNCCRRVLMTALSLHFLLDFDTQFVAVAMLFFLAMDVEPQAEHRISNKTFPAAVLLASAAVSLWIGTASFFYYLRNNETAAAIYPGYTMAQVNLLSTAEEQEGARLAGRILKKNDKVAAAYDVKALAQFHSGDYAGMAESKRAAIRLSRYRLRGYMEYFEFLQRAYEISLQQHNEEAAAGYLKEMKEIPEMLRSVKESTSSLGWKIKDQPQLELPDSYMLWLKAHG